MELIHLKTENGEPHVKRPRVKKQEHSNIDHITENNGEVILKYLISIDLIKSNNCGQRFLLKTHYFLMGLKEKSNSLLCQNLLLPAVYP
jgi:hypothetical protein